MKKILLLFFIGLLFSSIGNTKVPIKKKGYKKPKIENETRSPLPKEFLGITLGMPMDSAIIVIKQKYQTFPDRFNDLMPSDSFIFGLDYLGAHWRGIISETDGFVMSIMLETKFIEDDYNVIEQALMDKYGDYVDLEEDKKNYHRFSDDYISISLESSLTKTYITYNYLPLILMRQFNKDERHKTKIESAKEKL